MVNKKSPRQAYLIGLGVGMFAGAMLFIISPVLLLLVGLGLLFAGYKFKEVKKEAEDFFEIKED